MKKIFLVFCLPLATTLFFAQAGNDNVFMSSDKIFTLGKRVKSGEYVIDGNPYSNGKSFDKVSIDGYSKNVQDLRYNAYADEMEFSNNNETYYIDKIEGTVINFPTLKKTYVVKKYEYMGNTKVGYLVLLSKKDGKYGLYKREKVELIQGEKSPNAYGRDANDYYAKDKDLYLVGTNEGNYYKLPKNIGDLISQLSLDKKSVEDFTKSNKVNFNKETDLVKLFDFLNR